MRRQRNNQDPEQIEKEFHQQQDANTFLKDHVVRIRQYCHKHLIEDIAARLTRYQDLVKKLRDDRPKIEDFLKGIEDCETFYEILDEKVEKKAPQQQPASLSLCSQQHESASGVAVFDPLVDGKTILDTRVVEQVIASSPASARSSAKPSSAGADDGGNDDDDNDDGSVVPAPHTAFLKSLHHSRSTTTNAAANKLSKNATPTTSAASVSPSTTSTSLIVQATARPKTSQELAAARIAKVIGGNSNNNNNSNKGSNNYASGVTVFTTTKLNPCSASPQRCDDEIDGDERQQKPQQQHQQHQQEAQSASPQRGPSSISFDSATTAAATSVNGCGGGSGAVAISTNLTNKTSSSSSAYQRAKPKLPLPPLSKSTSPTTENAAAAATAAGSSSSLSSSGRFLDSISKKERRQMEGQVTSEELRVKTKKVVWTLPATLEPLVPAILQHGALLRKEALEMTAVFQELGAYILLSAGPVGRDASRLYSEDLEIEGFDPRDRDVGDLVISNSILMTGALQALANHRSAVLANLIKMERQNPILIHMVSTCNQGVAQMLLASWDYLLRGFTTMRRLCCLMHNLVGRNWNSLENLHKMNDQSQRVGDNLKAVATLKRRTGGGGGGTKKHGGK